MKALKLTILSIFIAAATNAQVGIQAGWNLNNLKYQLNGVEFDRSSTPGFNAGMFYRLPLSRHFVVEPALQYSRKGAMNTLPAGPVDYHKVRLDYIQAMLPFMYRYKVDRGMDFTLGAGPFLGILANADVITRYTNGTRTTSEYPIGNDNPGGFRSLDGGLRFTGGIRFARHINLSAAYDLGLADISPQANEEIRTRTFSINLGFMFW